MFNISKQEKSFGRRAIFLNDFLIAFAFLMENWFLEPDSKFNKIFFFFELFIIGNFHDNNFVIVSVLTPHDRQFESIWKRKNLFFCWIIHKSIANRFRVTFLVNFFMGNVEKVWLFVNGNYFHAFFAFFFISLRFRLKKMILFCGKFSWKDLVILKSFGKHSNKNLAE